jgi:ribonuclease P/MRP protein subunit POP5
MRTKRRYLAFEVLGGRDVVRDEVLDAMVSSHLRFAGEKAFSVSSPWLIFFDEETQRGIVRTNLDGLDDLRTSMTLITDIEGERAILRNLGVSGTIRACKDKFIRKSGPQLLERVEKRHGKEDPGESRRMADVKALVPGSKVRVSHKEFRLKRVFDDGRIDLASDEGSFGSTILDLLGSVLGDEE